MSGRIDNLDLIIAVRDLIKQADGSLTVYEAVYPNKDLPAEFVLVKALKQTDTGNVDADGTVEVCVYVRNRGNGDDHSQPNLSRLKALTQAVYPALFDAEKNGVFLNSTEMTLVKDADAGYFYNSLIIKTKSINLKYYK
jgi:hypothetical protein